MSAKEILVKSLPVAIQPVTLDANKILLLNPPWIVAVGKSIGGKGLFSIAKCDPMKFSESYNSAVQLLRDHGIIVGSGQGNPNRCRYISYDPELWYNASPATAPIVPIANHLATHDLELRSENDLIVHNSRIDNPEIFKKIVAIKSEGITICLAGSRHPYLIRMFTWCNKIGMSREFCMQATERFCRPMIANAENYDLKAN